MKFYRNLSGMYKKDTEIFYCNIAMQLISIKIMPAVTIQ